MNNKQEKQQRLSWSRLTGLRHGQFGFGVIFVEGGSVVASGDSYAIGCFVQRKDGVSRGEVGSEPEGGVSGWIEGMSEGGGHAGEGCSHEWEEARWIEEAVVEWLEEGQFDAWRDFPLPFPHHLFPKTHPLPHHLFLKIPPLPLLFPVRKISQQTFLGLRLVNPSVF